MRAILPCGLLLRRAGRPAIHKSLFLAAGSSVLPSDRSESTSYAVRFAENSNRIFMTLQNADICPSFAIFFPDIAIFADLQVFSIRYDNYQYDSRFIIMVYVY